MKKFLAFLLTGAMCVTLLVGCKGNTTGGGSGKIVEINFPTMWVGVNTLAPWFQEREQAFNNQYKDKYKLVVEEIPGDQAYVDKIKVMYSSNSLPDVFAAGGYNLINMMQSKLVDLTPYLNKDATWKAHLSAEGLTANSRDGKVYGIPSGKEIIPYFYNKDLFTKAGIAKPATTWDEFFAQADKLKAAGVTPLSMDTADSGWVSSLMLGTLIASDDAGVKFMNQSQPTDYNTPEFIDAATKIQKMFENYTTSDAIGGKFENAASNFLASKTAIISTGPSFVKTLYDPTMAPAGFADKVAVAAYPGGVMYDSGAIGYNIASKTKEKTDAAVAFVKFMTSDESQKLCLETSGGIPDSPTVTGDGDSKVKPLTNDLIKLGNESKVRIADYQSLWFANVVDEVSVQYPLLAQGKLTPTQFASALTAAAKKNG